MKKLFISLFCLVAFSYIVKANIVIIMTYDQCRKAGYDKVVQTEVPNPGDPSVQKYTIDCKDAGSKQCALTAGVIIDHFGSMSPAIDVNSIDFDALFYGILDNIDLGSTSGVIVTSNLIKTTYILLEDGTYQITIEPYSS